MYRLVAFLLLSLFVVNDAYAAVCGLPTREEWAAAAGSSQSYTHQGTAHAACMSATGEFVENVSGTNFIFQGIGSCEPTGSGNKYFYHHATQKGFFDGACVRTNQTGSFTSGVQGWQWTTAGCPGGGPYDPVTGLCGDPPQCSVFDPPLGSSTIQTDNPEIYLACSDGCMYADNSPQTYKCLHIDGSYWCDTSGWVASGETCTVGPSTPGTGATPPTDSDGDGVSDGNDSAPENPGDSGGEDQDGGGEDGSESCGEEGQPECDGTNGGSGQGNTSGGGGDCSSPPHSTGDAILAQIAFQAWATRCAVEGKANAGGGGGTGGDGSDMSGVESRLDSIKDYLDGDGQSLEDVEVPWQDGSGEAESWDSGLGGGACPAPISTQVTIAGHTAPIEFSFQPLCDFADLLYALVVAMGFLLSAYIIAGVRV